MPPKKHITLIVFGDRHNCEFAPASRIDDYNAAAEVKDAFIMQLAKDRKANAFIQPGDFWTDADRKPSTEFVGRVAAKWLATGIPVIGIAGNHDLIGGDPSSLPKTVSGLLNACGLFKILANGEEYHITNGDIDVCITGTSYHKEQDKPECVGDYIVSQKKGTCHIHLAHGMLSPCDLGPKIRHTTISAIESTAADVTICGHDHSGFGVVEQNGKLFMNPGSVLRMSCHEREFDRKPMVIVLTITQDGIKYEPILLPAEPADKVLSRDAVEAEKSKQQFSSEIRQSVERMKLGGTAIEAILNDIYNRESVPPDVREEIKARIEKKASSLKHQSAAPDDASVVRLTLHNFQSHADTTISLSEGLNVVLGESHAGKSAVLRSLRWVAENKPAGRSIIRVGTNECFVEAELKNGTVIRRFITDNDNGYHVTLPDGQTMDGNTKMVDTIQSLMGWNPMLVGSDKIININHMSQSASPMLIGDGYTGTERSRIIGSINNTDGCDEAIDEYALENARMQETRKHIVNEAEQLDSDSARFKDEQEQWEKAAAVAELAVKRDSVSEYLDSVNAFDEADAKYHALTDGYNPETAVEALAMIEKAIARRNAVAAAIIGIEKADEEYARATAIAAAIPDVDAMRDALQAILNAQATREKVAEQYGNYVNITKKLASIEKFAAPILAVDLNAINVIEELFNRRQSICNALAGMTDASARYDEQNKILVSLPDVDAMKTQMQVVETALVSRQAIADGIRSYDTAIKACGKAERVTAAAERQLTNAREALALEIQEERLCPVCGAIMDADAMLNSMN